MLYSVCLLGALRVVEAVESSHKVSCYPAYTLKRLSGEMIRCVDIISVYL